MYYAISGILFYLFSTVTIFAAVMVVFAKNPVHNVLFLILAFFSAAGIFLLTGAEFIAMTLIIVYVGAVAVLFLFVVMMIDVDLVAMKTKFSRYLPIGLVISLILAIDLFLVVRSSFKNLPILAVDTTTTNISNTHAIGKVLYTDYFFPFQIAGLVLLVAMISSIVLTLRNRIGVRKQDVNIQLSRNRNSSIEIVKVQTGVGIDGIAN